MTFEAATMERYCHCGDRLTDDDLDTRWKLCYNCRKQIVEEAKQLENDWLEYPYE